ALPDEVITPELRETFLAQAPAEADLAPDAVQAGAVFSGYRLPWAGGQSKHLSGSIGHYLVYNPPSCSEYYCRYAFDFAGRNTDTTTTLDTRFPLLAAKGGEVYAFYDGCATGNSNCTNYMVLKDSSTNPVTYQTYLHLDYNSIPAELKVKGKQVLQGQWIGNVDDTGYSTGDHVHFHVYATPTGTYWGPSVDITFDDVDINGGRPRTCYEANNWPSLGSECHAGGDEFVSGNYGAYPPTAALTLPGAGEVISDGSLLVAGQAWDNVGVLKAQAILKINGEWQLAGPAQVLGGATYESYVLDVDLCESDVPTGPLEVAVRVWDYEGNASIDPQSARTVTNRTFCIPPPPACQPSANQVALYSGPNYSGACRLLGAGNYTSASAFYPVADNSLSSLLVGSNVQALLFEQDGLTERSETIAWNDPNLADNRLGDNMMSSLQVAARTLAIDAPTLYTPFNVTTAAVTSVDSLVLDWAAPGAVSFQSTLSGPLSLSQDWTDSNGWSVGSLPAGTYTWTVNARSANGVVVPASRNFTVAAASLPGASQLGVPASQMEEAAGWTTTAAGLWHFETNYALGGRTLNGWVYNQDGDYGSATVGASDLTSPPITVPAGGWLAFDYNTLAEGAQAYWGQGWGEVLVGGGSVVRMWRVVGGGGEARRAR
ncbi:M23 family metallopeptidase, partial [bacterium]